MANRKSLVHYEVLVAVYFRRFLPSASPTNLRHLLTRDRRSRRCPGAEFYLNVDATFEEIVAPASAIQTP